MLCPGRWPQAVLHLKAHAAAGTADELVHRRTPTTRTTRRREQPRSRQRQTLTAIQQAVRPASKRSQSIPLRHNSGGHIMAVTASFLAGSRTLSVFGDNLDNTITESR